MKQVENELTLKCALCYSITKTPEFASSGQILDCESCEVHLASCDKLYWGVRKSPLIWRLYEYEVEDGNCNIQTHKAEILSNAVR